MEMNFIRYLFIFNTVFITIGGLLINYIEPYLPISLRRIFRYGKYNANIRHVVMETLEVPKSWFRHFYMFAAPASTVTLCLIFYKYFYNWKVPEIVLTLLDISFGASRKPLVPAENVIIAIVLFNVQCWKRLYETTSVSIFGNNKINVSLYLIGYIHYAGALLCFIGESEGFVRGSLYINRPWNKLTITILVCALIFLWSTYMQLHTNFILARLRKNRDGVVVSYSYNVPFHGLFEYVSSPLQFTEILMYFMLSLILWQASTYHYVTFWVMANQASSFIFVSSSQ
ncbi:polyprenol reductase isoform X2 [Odontomachus brunneus]|uniref:polyprenol reductase isoform X2 n=1 Tax=Odontomachus brunneus TaxID=486640 RepID=UPI0013F1B978|nr:polyprenol reductase isoform X2 [Odontomachus brunneus]